MTILTHACPPFKLGFRRQKRVKTIYGQLTFKGMEKKFEARDLLEGLFCFTTCQRTDGSLYGTATGNQCRQGVEVSIEEIETFVADRGRRVKSVNNSILLDQGLAADANLKSSSPTQASIEKARTEIMTRKNEILTSMKKGEDISAEVDNFLTDRLYMGDIYTSSRIVVGMEDTPTGDRGKGAAFDEYMAERIAVNEFKLQNPNRQREADFVSPAYDKEIPFHRHHAKALTTITGEPVSVNDLILANGSTASLELRAMPAIGIGTWEAGARPWVKNNPELSSLSSRESYKEAYDQKMQRNVTAKIMDAVNKNPNLKSVTLAAGNEGKDMTESIIYDLSRQPGAKSREFTYQMRRDGKPDGDLQNVRGRIVDPTGKGKVFVYDYGQSVSARRVSNGAGWYKLGREFATQEALLRAGETTAISKPSSVLKAKAKQLKAQEKAKRDRSWQEERAARAKVKKEKRALRQKEEDARQKRREVKAKAREDKRREQQKAREVKAKAREDRRREQQKAREDRQKKREARAAQRSRPVQRKPKKAAEADRSESTQEQKKAATLKAITFQVQGMKAQGMKNAQIRELIRSQWGAISTQVSL